MNNYGRLSLAALLSAAVFFGAAGPAFGSAASAEKNSSADYPSKLFNSSYVHEINIDIAGDDWQTIKEDAISRPHFSVTVTIDGEEYSEVGFSPKGASSLAIAASYSFFNQRYSYRLDFNKYNKNQRYHGLKEIYLNNSFMDPTCLTLTLQTAPCGTGLRRMKNICLNIMPFLQIFFCRILNRANLNGTWIASSHL